MRYTHIPQTMQGNLKFRAQGFSRLVFLLVLALATAGIAAAQAILVPPQVGPYGVVLNTTSTDTSTQGGAGMLDVFNFDGAGGVTGTYTLELGSGPNKQFPDTVTGSFTGTYIPNPDDPNGITWKVTIALDQGGVVLTLVMVVDDHGRGLQLALTGCSGPICGLTGQVVSGFGEAQFGGSVHPLHTGFLSSSYGMQSTKSSPSPQTSVEVWTFDGAGGVTFSGAFVGPPADPFQNPNLPNVQYGNLNGFYTVNPDGTGTITIPPKFVGGNVHTWAFVITRSGLLALQTDRPGWGVVYLTGRLQ
jgi:hypothetical protein